MVLERLRLENILITQTIHQENLGLEDGERELGLEAQKLFGLSGKEKF